MNGEVRHLYDFTATDDPAKRALYARGDYETHGGMYRVRAGATLDLVTYFNAFSLAKWRRYTTLTAVTLRLALTGACDVTVVARSPSGETVLHQEKAVTGAWTYTLPIGAANVPEAATAPHAAHAKNATAAESATDAKNVALIGVRLMARTDGSVCGGYDGTFAAWRPQRIGAVICTYRREAFVTRLMDVLDGFAAAYDWLHVLVVDNGGTLPVGQSASGNVETLRSRNYGGSGGFTRGMIELVARGADDVILLMDDDIVIEPSAIERMHAMLCGLRETYRDSFFSGAMLSMEQPCVQWENTARWCIRSFPAGHNLDLSQPENLCTNETPRTERDRYGGWWFCALPAKRVRALGYPLPNFIKCDDMEYGLRNGKELLTLNGVGVWHAAFAGKTTPITYYFHSRNALILEHYAHDSWAMFALHVVLRACRRCGRQTLTYLAAYDAALRDYATGYEGITAIGADARYAQVQRDIAAHATPAILWHLAQHMASVIRHYPETRDRYRAFRDERLRDARFWNTYLGIPSTSQKEGATP